MKEGQEILIGSHYNKYFNTFDITKRQVLNIPLPHGITNTKVCATVIIIQEIIQFYKLIKIAMYTLIFTGFRGIS